MDWLSKHQFASAVLDALSANICVLDRDGTIFGANAAWRRFSKENGGLGDYTGTNYISVCRSTVGRGAAAANRLALAIEQILAGQQQFFEIEYPCHGPRERRWFLASVTALPTPDATTGQGAVISHAEITSRKTLELQLKRSAETDELTGLRNRRKFISDAEKALRRLKDHGTRASLIFADLDHFKQINDRHGHVTGDDALCRAAARFRQAVRRRDVVARIGGEEFAILLPETDEWGAVMVAERMRQLLATSRPGSGDAPTLTASFGVTSFRKEDLGVDDGLARADEALYQAKQRGRNRVQASSVAILSPEVA